VAVIKVIFSVSSGEIKSGFSIHFTDSADRLRNKRSYEVSIGDGQKLIVV